MMEETLLNKLSEMALTAQSEKIEKMRLVFRAMTSHLLDWKQAFTVFCGQDELELYKDAIAFHVGAYPFVTEMAKENKCQAPRFILHSEGYCTIMKEN